MQHCQVLVLFLRHQAFAPDPVHHLPNASTGINIAVQSIPKDGQKPTLYIAPLGDVAKLNDIILESVQLRIFGANNGYVGELGYSCTALFALFGCFLASREFLP